MHDMFKDGYKYKKYMSGKNEAKNIVLGRH